METTTLDWTIQDTASVHGWVLKPGTEVSIRGERGRFTFIRYVERPDGHCWVDFIGGLPGATMFRSFRPDRISNVYGAYRE